MTLWRYGSHCWIWALGHLPLRNTPLSLLWHHPSCWFYSMPSWIPPSCIHLQPATWLWDTGSVRSQYSGVSHCQTSFSPSSCLCSLLTLIRVSCLTSWGRLPPPRWCHCWSSWTRWRRSSSAWSCSGWCGHWHCSSSPSSACHSSPSPASLRTSPLATSVCKYISWCQLPLSWRDAPLHCSHWLPPPSPVHEPASFSQWLQFSRLWRNTRCFLLHSSCSSSLQWLTFSAFKC